MNDRAQVLSIPTNPRTHRVLTTRAHFKIMNGALMAITGPWVIFGLVSLASYGMSGNTLAVTISIWAGIALPLGLFLLAFIFGRPIADTMVTIETDHLVVKRLNKEDKLNYSNIQTVKFSFIPYSGGWMRIITKDGKSFSFTAALERSEYILDAILAYDPKIVDLDACASYRRTAIYYDHSWARMIANFSNRNRFIVKYGLSILMFPVAFFLTRQFVYQESPPNLYQMIWAFLFEAGFAFLLGAVIWAIAEIAILAPHSRRQLIKNPERVLRPVEFERTVAIWSDLAFLLIQAAVLGLLI